jgi:hypothetical protein
MCELPRNLLVEALGGVPTSERTTSVVERARAEPDTIGDLDFAIVHCAAVDDVCTCGVSQTST